MLGDWWRAVVPAPTPDAPHAMPAAADMPTTPLAMLVAIAGLSAVLGGGVALAIAPQAWAVDAMRNFQAATDLLAGRFGTDGGYLYSPLAALLTVPATWVPAGVALGAWLALKLTVLAWGIRHETRGLGLPAAALVALAVVTFVPTLHDLLLGNVTVLLVAAVALVAWRPDHPLSGLALGLVLATAPKPQLIPILVWMVLFRPRALLGAAVTALAATLGTILIVGKGPYLAWLEVLRAPDYLATSMAGNLAPQALLPALASLIWLVTAGGLLLAFRRGERPALIAALTAGLLLAPYTMAYGAMALLLAVRPVAERLPAVAVALAAASSLAVILLLPVYALSWLFAGLAAFPSGRAIDPRPPPSGSSAQ